MSLKVDEVKHEQKSVEDDDWIEAGNNFDENDEYEDFDTYKFKEVGDELVGILRGSFEGEWNNKGYIIEIDENRGRLVWASSAQLKQALPQVPIDAKVKIVFEGETKTDKPNPMKNFRVYYKETD